MGLFKKKENDKKQLYTREMVHEAMLNMKDTERTVIKIDVSDDEVSLTDSKFSGLPYLPNGKEIPRDKDGNNLQMLAQINLEQLPKQSFPISKGILQFWIANDDGDFGLDYEAPISQKDWRVIYYENIEDCVKEQELLNKYKGLQETNDVFPIQHTFKLNFTLDKEIVSTLDYSFDEKFLKSWNKIFSDKQLEDAYDLPDKAFEWVYDEHGGDGHKLLGYPYFTQADPRSEDDYSDYVLLLQIDSIGTDKHDIMWMDSGVCNFFIKKEDLENRDFSSVLYNWDCC